MAYHNYSNPKIGWESPWHRYLSAGFYDILIVYLFGVGQKPASLGDGARPNTSWACHDVRRRSRDVEEVPREEAFQCCTQCWTWRFCAKNHGTIAGGISSYIALYSHVCLPEGMLNISDISESMGIQWDFNHQNWNYMGITMGMDQHIFFSWICGGWTSINNCYFGVNIMITGFWPILNYWTPGIIEFDDLPSLNWISVKHSSPSSWLALGVVYTTRFSKLFAIWWFSSFLKAWSGVQQGPYKII